MQRTDNLYIPLKHRSILRLSGKDTISFLQGILTQDMTLLEKKQPVYALMLTPQGKFLYDFFLVPDKDNTSSIWMDCRSDKLDTILRSLNMYKLHSDVTIENFSESHEVVVLVGENICKQLEKNQPRDKKQMSEANPPHTIRFFCKGLAFIDPRLTLSPVQKSDKKHTPAPNHNPITTIGRSYIERNNHYQSFNATGFTLGLLEDYNIIRMMSSTPDGDEDMQMGEHFPLQFGMHHVGAISFTKGCYIGQEVTIRSYHRDSIPKQIVALKLSSGDSLVHAHDIVLYKHKPIGHITSSHDTYALALVKASAELKAGHVTTINNHDAIVLS